MYILVVDAFENQESSFEAQVSNFKTLKEFFEKTIYTSDS